MAIDIIGHINTEVTNLDATQRNAMLDDYVEYYDYDQNNKGLTKKEFANEMMIKELKDKVKSVRIKRAYDAAQFEELVLESTP